MISDRPLIHAQIEITKQCNARCRYCCHSSDSGGDRQTSMNPARFEMLLDQMSATTGQIHLQGVGEPLMHPDFERLLSACKSRALTTGTTTNGILLGRQNLYNLDYLYVSLDSMVTWDGNDRLGIRPELIVRNLDVLLGSSERPKVYLTVVVSDKNVAQVKDILQYASHREGLISGVVLAPMLDLTHGRQGLSMDARGELKAITCGFPEIPIDERAITGGRKARCHWLADKVYFDVNGVLRLCCIRGRTDDLQFGSGFASRLEDLLSMPLVQHKARELRVGQFDELCTRCIESRMNLLWD